MQRLVNSNARDAEWIICKLALVIQKQPKIYTMDGPDKLRIKLPLPEGADRFNAARGLLTMLAPR